MYRNTIMSNSVQKYSYGQQYIFINTDILYMYKNINKDKQDIDEILEHNVNVSGLVFITITTPSSFR